MTWTLIVVAVAGQQWAVTVPNLTQCQHEFLNAQIYDVQDAYCLSATGDRVYLIKDGISFRVLK